MGLVLDSGVLIAAERDARPVSELLATLERERGETEIVLSSITVIELENGLHRGQTIEQAGRRREYLDTVFAAVPVESFTREMTQLAAKIDAEARRTGQTIPFGPADRHDCPQLRLRARHPEPAALSDASQPGSRSTLRLCQARELLDEAILGLRIGPNGPNGRT
jgi:predicted nucleic acid-binding protein